MYRNALLSSSFLSRVCLMPEMAEAGIGHNNPPAILPDLTAQEQPTVWDRTELEDRLRALRPELVALQTGNDSLTARVTVLLAEFAQREAQGYSAMVNGAITAIPPSKPTAEEMRVFARKALSLDDLTVKPEGDKNTRLSYKPGTINAMISVATKAAILVAMGHDGYRIGYFVGSQSVPANTKGALPRICAPWNKLEPVIKIGKGDVDNPKDTLVIASANAINTSYAVCVDGKGRDKYGKLVKGADDNKDTLGDRLSSMFDELHKLMGTEEGFTELEANKDRISGLADAVNLAYDAIHEDDPVAFVKGKLAAKEATKAGGKTLKKSKAA